MKTFARLVFGVLFLSLPALASTLAISANGRGGSELAAIASAKRQIILDAQSAGLLAQDGYRIGGIRVVEVTRTGKIFHARVDADVIKDLEYKRVLFVISGNDDQSSWLLALVQRVRSTLSEERSGKQPHIEVVDVLATGGLRIFNPADIQRPGIDEELEQLARLQHADVLYLLNASGEANPIFLVSARNEIGRNKTIRTLRGGVGENSPSLVAQIVDSVRQDVIRQLKSNDIHSVVTLPALGTNVRKGQSVILYADRTDDGGVRESSIVTHGIVTEVSASKVRVLTEQPVATSPSIKLRLSPLPKRGIVITESDW